MKYALTGLLKHGQPQDRYVVSFNLGAFQMCAKKVKEFNPGPFASRSEEDLVKEMVSHGDQLVKGYGAKLLATPGLVVSAGTGGYVIQAWAFAGIEVIQLEALIDPGVLFYNERVELGMFESTASTNVIQEEREAK